MIGQVLWHLNWGELLDTPWGFHRDLMGQGWLLSRLLLRLLPELLLHVLLYVLGHWLSLPQGQLFLGLGECHLPFNLYGLRFGLLEPVVNLGWVRSRNYGLVHQRL